MAFVHKQSCEGLKSELDLFAVPPTQTSIIDSHVVEHQPMSSLDSGGPIEFLIPGSGDDYTDVAATMLHVQAKITKADGSDLDVAEPVGPVNNWLHSLFSQVDVYLNGTLVTPSTNTYPYRAYIETLLSYGNDAKETQLTSQLWCKDPSNRMESVEIDGDASNAGFVTRRASTVGSRVVDMMGRIHADFFLQDKFLINGVDMKVRMVRSKDAFALMAGGGNTAYKIKIVNAALFVKKVTLNPGVQMAHITTLEKNTAKYPMRPVHCKVFSIPAGTRSYTHENLFLGALPKRLVVCCIDNDAFNGSFAKNPFNAKNNHINFFAVYADGRQIPTKPFQPKFDSNLFVRSYHSLFTSTGKVWQDEGNGLTLEDFRHGYTFFGLDLTPDGCDDCSFHLVEKSNLRMELHFCEALPTTVDIVVYAEFEAVLEIDKNRNVIFDH
ncbi:hypothetical protein DJ031_00495 [bacterium endosymbiont of Escarpia laminata]|nr:MAG: hypothetical protein DJ031_00495 [bacterium endosymbiont of Escarpia laminata]